MKQEQKQRRFIPFRNRDIVEMCLQDNRLPDNSIEVEKDFRAFHHMINSIFHFEFHQIIESLKDSYASVDPDRDTIKINLNLDDNLNTSSNERRLKNESDFVTDLENLLEKANYEKITQSDLNQALNESSLFNIRLHVEFDDFSEVLLFSRGESVRDETVSTWFGLRKKTLSFTNYDRIVVFIRFNKDLQESKNTLPNCRPGSTLLKLFQNVPKADLEMLFPNTRVRMRLIDKLLIGVPAMISGGIVLTTKLGASILLIGSLMGFWLGLNSQPVELNKTAVMTLLAGIAALGGYLWKQFNSFKNRKLKFMQSLTQNLYFKNLDNNAGVFHRLANDAEEEESKEALLAYYFLLINQTPMTKIQLDKKIEDWLKVKWDCSIDFEIEDALHKLIKLQLVEVNEDQLTAVSLKNAIQYLDKRWDDYFLP